MNASNPSKFDSISPSALSLLETRAFTSIPFAKESFQIISQSHSSESTSQSQLPVGVLFRIIHFESRYRSIDQGLRDLGITNILEFSSGFSFRGLDFCKNPTIQFIDSDLPAIIETKKKILLELTKNYCDYQPHNLLLKPMNALDEKDFFDTISLFSSGPISIVKEGLLMYLNIEQKEHLCNIIHKILSQVGGYWITSDIYRQGEIEGRNIDNFYKQKGQEFLKKHNVENNKFSSFAVAEDFFSRCGFEIFKKIEVEKTALSSVKLLSEYYPSSVTNSISRSKSRETWILKPI